MKCNGTNESCAVYYPLLLPRIPALRWCLENLYKEIALCTHSHTYTAGENTQHTTDGHHPEIHPRLTHLEFLTGASSLPSKQQRGLAEGLTLD